MEAAVHGTSCYVPSCGTVPPPRRLPSKAGSEVYYGTWLEAAVSACALPDTDYAILSTEFAPSRRREAKLFRFKAAASALRRSIRHLEYRPAGRARGEWDRLCRSPCRTWTIRNRVSWTLTAILLLSPGTTGPTPPEILPN